MKTRTSNPKFESGQLCCSRGVYVTLPDREIREALCRHFDGDWGDVGVEDWMSNDDAVLNGSRLLSSYRSVAGIKFWIITEADRSVTTVLFPEEY